MTEQTRVSVKAEARKSDGSLERVLAGGGFAVTAELGPPRGNDADAVRKKAELLKGHVDAVNITDNQTAVVRMSSIATGVIAARSGLDPIIQMVCRDRNRIAMQSDILGATALGMRNILCLSGDHQLFGDYPYAKNVFDIDSIQLIGLVKRMRDQNRLLESDRELQGSVRIFIGAAANPFAEPLEFRPLRLRKKVDAGVDFIQTQCIFDMRVFRRWLRAARDMGLHERCHILAGLTPLKSPGMAKYMAKNVAGMIIPDEIIRRLVGVPKGRAAEEGIRICCEQIEELKQMEGVHGIHLMAIEWEHRVPEIVERAGLLPRPRGLSVNAV
jgi:methylenetetrahydrofolate reductase (NADPH)